MLLQINNWFLCQLRVHRDMKHAVAWKARKRKSCSRRITFRCASVLDIPSRADEVRVKLQRWNWFVRQPYIYRDMKLLGSLNSTQEARVALVYLFFSEHFFYSKKHILITYIVLALLTIQHLILTLLTIRRSILTLLTIRRLILTLLTIRRLILTLLTIQYNTIQ